MMALDESHGRLGFVRLKIFLSDHHLPPPSLYLFGGWHFQCVESVVAVVLKEP
jgi:hypothetical protein